MKVPGLDIWSYSNWKNIACGSVVDDGKEKNTDTRVKVPGIKVPVEDKTVVDRKKNQTFQTQKSRFQISAAKTKRAAKTKEDYRPM